MVGNVAFIGFIPVRDLERAREFYEGVLDIEVLEESPVALTLDADGTDLRLTLVDQFAPQPFTIAGWVVEDIELVVRVLGERGVTFTRYDDMGQDELGIWSAPSGDRVAWFLDPDGNTLSLTAWG